MADICKELRKDLKVLDGLRESCLSVLVKEGMESDAAKKAVREFDTLAEELRDATVFYRQPFNERLDDIERKMEDKKPLDRRECRLLYGVDWYPGRLKYEEDKRRKEIVEKWRSDEEKKQDLAIEFDTTPNRISVTEEEALSGNIRYHYDELYLKDTASAKGVTLPEEIGGHLLLAALISAEGLELPRKIGGGLVLSGLTSTQGITNWPIKIRHEIIVSQALPDNEKEELKKQYPDQVQYV